MTYSWTRRLSRDTSAERAGSSSGNGSVDTSPSALRAWASPGECKLRRSDRSASSAADAAGRLGREPATTGGGCPGDLTAGAALGGDEGTTGTRVRKGGGAVAGPWRGTGAEREAAGRYDDPVAAAHEESCRRHVDFVGQTWTAEAEDLMTSGPRNDRITGGKSLGQHIFHAQA